MSEDRYTLSLEEINIEKCYPSEFEKEPMPFLILPTKVIQEATKENSLATIIWVYLQSLPPNWTPNKTQLMKHFEIGMDKYKKVTAYLVKTNLISFTKSRKGNGRFGAVRMVVHNGLKFTSLVDSSHNPKKPEGGKPHQWLTTLVENTQHINNIYIQNKEDNNTSYSPPMEDVAKASQNHNQNQANEIEPTQKKPSKQKAQRTEEQDQLIRELIQCYNRVLSKHRVTKHLTNPIRKDVKNTLTNTIKQWNTHLTTKFTIEKFEAYLEHLAATKHWLITPYRNKSGNEVIKGIPLICNWESILRVKEDIEQEESNEN